MAAPQMTGKELRRLREDLGLSRYEAVVESGWSYQSWKEAENSYSSYPKILIWIRLYQQNYDLRQSLQQALNENRQLKHQLYSRNRLAYV